jgi:hypothetical protein
MNRNITVTFSLPRIVILLGSIGLGFALAQLFTFAEDTVEVQKQKQLARQPIFVSPPMPDKLTFAGEEVPLHKPAVREQLEKQIIINMYQRYATSLIIKRAHRWRKEFEAILAENDIPKDFFYMAVAESGLRNVRSYAGAEGYWQFMRATAREYGLEVNSYVDERYDPVKSTQAACRYLNRAYDKFGNWALCAASYNMGMGGVNQNLNFQEEDNYYDLYLNHETANYMYRLLAFKVIMSNPEQYGFKIYPGDLYDDIPHDSVTVDQSISNLVDFAKRHGTTYHMLKHMNPWLQRSKLPNRSKKEYLIRLTTPEYKRPSQVRAEQQKAKETEQQTIDG